MNQMKLIRLTRGLTQREMASLLGIHENNYSRMETGLFARPFRGLEARLESVFGEGWTFERLMEPVPSPDSALNSEASRES